MTKIEKTFIWRLLPRVLEVLICILASVVTLIVVAETACREFDFLNFSGYEEILIMVAFWLYMLGCGHGSFEKSQITADIAESMMKECKFKEIIRVLKVILSVVLAFWFAWWGLNLIIYAIGVHTVTPIYRIPMVIGYTSIFVGMLFMCFYNVVYGIGELKQVYMRQIKHMTNEEIEAKYGVKITKDVDETAITETKKDKKNKKGGATA